MPGNTKTPFSWFPERTVVNVSSICLTLFATPSCGELFNQLRLGHAIGHKTSSRILPIISRQVPRNASERAAESLSRRKGRPYCNLIIRDRLARCKEQMCANAYFIDFFYMRALKTPARGLFHDKTFLPVVVLPLTPRIRPW